MATEGHVTIVGLLQTSSSFSREQARLLQQLKDKFRNENVTVLGVTNLQHQASASQPVIDGVRFPVFYAPVGVDAFKKMGGRQDDVFIYDRCGLLSHYIQFPSSDVKDGYVEAALVKALHSSPCVSACHDKSVYNQTHQSAAVVVSTNRYQIRRRRRDLSYVVHQNNTGLNNDENLATLCQGFTERNCATDQLRNNAALRHLRTRCCHYVTNQHRLPQPQYNSHCVCVERRNVTATASNVISRPRFGCACDIKVSHHASKQCACELTDNFVIQKCQRGGEFLNATQMQCLMTIRDSFCTCQASPRVEGSSSENHLCIAHVQPLIKPQQPSGLPCSCNKSVVDGRETLVCTCQRPPQAGSQHREHHSGRMP